MTMFDLIRPAVKGKNVLELATGTGFIAKNILCDASSVEATDNSTEMIKKAKEECFSSKLHFSVQSMLSLPYKDESFPVIIAANVLHAIANPEKALAEISRVLTEDGVLITPIFSHIDLDKYLALLAKNGWKIKRAECIETTFPLTYVECTRK